MPEYFVVSEVKFAGEKDNPHGGTLYKFYVSLGADIGGAITDDVYWQRKSRDLGVGEKVYGHIEQGEYGPRFKTDQRPDGNFKAPVYEVQPGGPSDPQAERSRRIERQHSQEMALRLVALLPESHFLRNPDVIGDTVGYWTDHFAEDLDVELGSGQAAHGASEQRPPVDGDAADLSVVYGLEADVGGVSPATDAQRQDTRGTADVSPEASPAQKGALTKLFHEAGLSREAMKAVVMFRCGQEKATKQGASQLITDLQDGATHDALLAEIYDAHRAGNPLGTRAAALIPSETPADTEGLPELDPEAAGRYR